MSDLRKLAEMLVRDVLEADALAHGSGIGRIERDVERILREDREALLNELIDALGAEEHLEMDPDNVVRMVFRRLSEGGEQGESGDACGDRPAAPDPHEFVPWHVKGMCGHYREPGLRSPCMRPANDPIHDVAQVTPNLVGPGDEYGPGYVEQQHFTNQRLNDRIAELERELNEHKASRIAYASEFDGDVGSIHENIRKLKRERDEALAARDRWRRFYSYTESKHWKTFEDHNDWVRLDDETTTQWARRILYAVIACDPHSPCLADIEDTLRDLRDGKLGGE